MATIPDETVARAFLTPLTASQHVDASHAAVDKVTIGFQSELIWRGDGPLPVDAIVERLLSGRTVHGARLPAGMRFERAGGQRGLRLNVVADNGSTWVHNASITIERPVVGAERVATLRGRLEVNPTRWRATYPDTPAGSLRAVGPRRRYRPNQPTNVLPPDIALRPVPPRTWLRDASAIIDAVVVGVHRAIMGRFTRSETPLSLGPLSHQNTRVTLSEVEIYWEFQTGCSEGATAEDIFTGMLAGARGAAQALGIRHTTQAGDLGGSIRMPVRTGVVVKVYAKTADRIRLELEYRSTSRLAPARLPISDRLIALAQDGAVRADRVLQVLRVQGEASQQFSPGLYGSLASRIMGVIGNDPAKMEHILTSLLQDGAVWAGSDPHVNRSLARRLETAGVLERASAEIRSRRGTGYRLASRFRSLLYRPN